jgi:hypothetical protein
MYISMAGMGDPILAKDGSSGNDSRYLCVFYRHAASNGGGRLANRRQFVSGSIPNVTFIHYYRSSFCTR